MADPLSVVASIVGITTAALQTLQFLSHSIDSIKDVPDTIKSVKADLQAVEPVLRSVHTALERDDKQIFLSDQIKPAVENCNRACTAFQTDLDHWMRHSTEEKIFGWINREWVCLGRRG
jgi:hypothetical protein